MKGYFYCLVLLISFKVDAQPNLYDSVNTRYNKISKAGVRLLSGWAAASLVSGLVGKNNSVGELKYFYKRNVLWGSINLGLSALSYLRIRSEDHNSYTVAQTFKKTEAVQKVFLINAGLDVAYVAFGLYTRERANKFTGDKQDRLWGTGNSLLFQGGFLTLFDAVFYILHNKNGNQLEKALERLSFTSNSYGPGLAYRF
jgi:hypothetical protein